MRALLVVHAVLAFSLELAMLAALGLFGFRAVDGPWLNIVLAILLAAIAIGLWAYFAAPKSATRLGMPALLIFKVAMFGAGALALWLAGEGGWAIVFAVLAAIDLGVAVALGAV